MCTIIPRGVGDVATCAAAFSPLCVCLEVDKDTTQRVHSLTNQNYLVKGGPGLYNTNLQQPGNTYNGTLISHTHQARVLNKKVSRRSIQPFSFISLLHSKKIDNSQRSEQQWERTV